MRYLQGTSKYALCYGTGKPHVEGFSDSDMSGDIDTMRSTSGYLFTFGGGAVSWQSRLQKCVALSTTEAEYIVITECCKEMRSMKELLKETGIAQDRFVVFSDSQSAIHVSKNPSFHSRSKHIKRRYHWIREVLEKKELYLEKVHTDENGSDMMTKGLPKGKHEICCAKAGLIPAEASL